ncbi:hypothetical protein K440DRAFT_621718, partial [Wilcoxina mikolae CBS 423.85]
MTWDEVRSLNEVRIIPGTWDEPDVHDEEEVSSQPISHGLRPHFVLPPPEQANRRRRRLSDSSDSQLAYSRRRLNSPSAVGGPTSIRRSRCSMQEVLTRVASGVVEGQDRNPWNLKNNRDSWLEAVYTKLEIIHPVNQYCAYDLLTKGALKILPQIEFPLSRGRILGQDEGGPLRDVLTTVISQDLERSSGVFERFGTRFFLKPGIHSPQTLAHLGHLTTAFALVHQVIPWPLIHPLMVLLPLRHNDSYWVPSHSLIEEGAPVLAKVLLELQERTDEASRLHIAAPPSFAVPVSTKIKDLIPVREGSDKSISAVLDEEWPATFLPQTRSWLMDGCLTYKGEMLDILHMLKNSGPVGVRTIRRKIFADWLGSRGNMAMIFGRGLAEWDVLKGLKEGNVSDEEVARWLNQGQRLSSGEDMVTKVLRTPIFPIEDNEREAKMNSWSLLKNWFTSLDSRPKSEREQWLTRFFQLCCGLTEWDGRHQIDVGFTNSNALLQQWCPQNAEPPSEVAIEMAGTAFRFGVCETQVYIPPWSPDRPAELFFRALEEQLKNDPMAFSEA